MNKAVLSRRKCKQVVVAAAIALAVGLLDAAGALRGLDNAVYDAALRFASTLSNTPARVLLVYMERKQLSGDSNAASGVARELLDLGARKVGFTCDLPNPSAELVQLAEQTGDVFLSRGFRASPFDPGKFDLTAVPADSGKMVQGLSGVLSADAGVYRSHFGGLLIDGDSLPSLEAAMALEALSDGQRIPSGRFRVAFRGPSGSLPHVQYESVVDGDLVRELVDGKMALVGLKPDQQSPGISTPTTRGKANMSLLEYHGHALQTLLTTGPVNQVPAGGRALLMLISALTCHTLFRTVRLRWSLVLAGGLLLFDVAGAVALLCWFSLWIPCMPVALVLVACLVEVVATKFRLYEHAVGGVLLDQSIRLRRRRIQIGSTGTDDPGTDDPWSQLTSLLYEQFDCLRIVVLECPANSVRLQEVTAVGCDLDDIVEIRRDRQRWPFSVVSESKLPLRVDKSEYSFLTRGDASEHQYLVQLAANNEILGFLAIGLAAHFLEACPNCLLRLQSTADDFAVLLHRWRWAKVDRELQQSWRGLLTSMPEEKPIHQLGQSNHLLEDRLVRLEKTYETLDTACAIFDMFGKLLLKNARLSRLLHEQGIVVREMSALDLLCSVTGRDRNYCRELMQKVIGDKRAATVQIALAEPVRVCRVIVRPLSVDMASSVAVRNDDGPYQLHGIHVEVVDGASFVETHEARDHITHGFIDDVSKHLDEVHGLVSRLAEDTELPAKYQRIGESVESSLSRVVSAAHELQSFISSDLNHQSGK